MKRYLLIIAIFLLAGAVVNVAVAWKIAYHTTPISRTPWHFVTFPESNQFWLQRRPPDWKRHSLIDVTRRQGLGRTVTTARGRTAPSERVVVPELPTEPGVGYIGPPPGSEMIIQHECRIIEAAYGWPQRSLRWTAIVDEGFYARTPVIDIAQAFQHRRLLLPLLPIWFGFAANTLFYGLLLWLPICGPYVLRQFIRRRRGLCPACAYPISESEVCSECGKAQHENCLPKQLPTPGCTKNAFGTLPNTSELCWVSRTRS